MTFLRNETDIKLVALDFDLTIYDYREPKRTLELAPWFKRLSQHGVLAGLASGRQVDDLHRTLREIDFPSSRPFPSFVICEEGVIMNADGTELPSARQWNRWRCQKVLESNARLKPLFELCIEKALARGLKCIEDLVCDNAGIRVVFETPAMAEEVRRSLLDAVSEMRDLRISRNHHIVLGLPAGADKGGGLAKLTELQGWDHAQVLAIGDNLNDLSMLDGPYAFQVATMANGEPFILEAVAARGGFIASAEGPSGVKEIFDFHFGMPDAAKVDRARASRVVDIAAAKSARKLRPVKPKRPDDTGLRS